MRVPDLLVTGQVRFPIGKTGECKDSLLYSADIFKTIAAKIAAHGHFSTLT